MILEDLFNEYMEVDKALESEENQKMYQAITSGRVSGPSRLGTKHILSDLVGKSLRGESSDLTQQETLDWAEDQYKLNKLLDRAAAAQSKEALQDRLAKLRQEIIELCVFQGSRGLISYEGQLYYIKPNGGELIVERKS